MCDSIAGFQEHIQLPAFSHTQEKYDKGEECVQTHPAKAAGVPCVLRLALPSSCEASFIFAFVVLLQDEQAETLLSPSVDREIILICVELRFRVRYSPKHTSLRKPTH